MGESFKAAMRRIESEAKKRREGIERSYVIEKRTVHGQEVEVKVWSEGCKNAISGQGGTLPLPETEKKDARFRRRGSRRPSAR